MLRGLNMIEPAELEEALKRLAQSVDAPVAPPQRVTVAASAEEDPKRFLMRVMNDDSITLALRIEAAKALLQHSSWSHALADGPRRHEVHVT